VSSIELERRFPDPEKLERIAAALGLQPFQLFLDEEEWNLHDRYESLVTLVGDLRGRINRELDQALQRYLR
jgi:transcriptional regulator with XRE-family HTH domain